MFRFGFFFFVVLLCFDFFFFLVCFIIVVFAIRLCLVQSTSAIMQVTSSCASYAVAQRARARWEAIR